GVELGFPPIQEFERACGIRDFVAEIVGPAAVGVEIVEILMKLLGKQPRDHVEIFVVMGGEMRSVFLRDVRRTTCGRQVRGQVEFVGAEHGSENGVSRRDGWVEIEARFLASRRMTAFDYWGKPGVHGRTASLISPLRAFMRSKACGKSASVISSV